MKPLSVKKPPDRVIVVDPVGEVHNVSNRNTARVETLESWSATKLVRKDGVLRGNGVYSGINANDFWDRVGWWSHNPVSIWIVSYQCTRVWAMLGLWGELEDGRCRIAGADYRKVNGEGLPAQDVRPGLLVNEDPPNMVELRLDGLPGRILWLDVRNWGVDMPADLIRGRPTVDVLVDLLVRMEHTAREHGLGALCPTAASQAWRYWRSTKGAEGVHCHGNPEALELERAAHIGGRCEAFRLGELEGPHYHLDFRSHYGAVMSEEPMPIRLAGFNDRIPSMTLVDPELVESSIADVTIETDEPAYPYWRESGTIYPVGTFRTALCGPELVDAVYHARIRKWHSVAWYDVGLVLSHTASKIYKIRQSADLDSDKMISSWAKQMLVGLSGKLGYRNKCWDVVPGAIAPEPWCEWLAPDEHGELHRHRSMAGIVQREHVGGYGSDAVPSMAAWITSYGRMRLLRAIRIAGWNHVVYVDTDSLIVDEDGYYALAATYPPTDGEIGTLEVRAGPSHVEVRGIKYYVEQGKTTCAGRARGVAIESVDGRGYWLSRATVDRLREDKPAETVSTFQCWPIPAAYHHGVVCEDGKITPHRIENG